MPGPVFRGRAAAPAAQWSAGKLLDADGVGTLLVRRGVEWFAGKSATPAFRVRDGIVYRGASSEPHARIQRGQVYAGNSSQTLYRLVGDGLLASSGNEPLVRGPGLSAEELVLAALVLGP